MSTGTVRLQFQVLWACRFGYTLGIHRGTRHPGKLTLPNHRHLICLHYPRPPGCYWLSPAFFLSQSNSIFNQPISP